MIEAFSLAAGLAWASGLRLYLAVFLVGLAAHSGIVYLPGTLHILSSPWVICTAALLATVEFLADKISPLDSLWDAVHTFIRIPAGAVFAMAVMPHGDPSALGVAALLGATLAGAAHLTKAGTRALINLSPESISNGFASFAEDMLVLGGLSLALFMPVLFLALLVAFLLLAGWALPRLWRSLQDSWRLMSVQMVPAPIRRPQYRHMMGKRD